jgi:hypothetical protein
MRLRHLLAVLTALPGLARAYNEPEQPPRVADLGGARSMAMGSAFRAVGTSNDTLWFNPAGMAATSRYQLDTTGYLSFGRPYGGFGASIMDSTNGPVALGFMVDRFIQGPGGDRFTSTSYHLSLAVPIGEYLAVGITAKWLHQLDLIRHNAVTADVGLLFKYQILKVALVGANLVDVRSDQVPRRFSLGLAVGHEEFVQGSLDAVLDLSTRPDPSFTLGAGVEWLAYKFVTLRGGYMEDRIRPGHFLSGGVGLFGPPGIGVDVGYRHQLGGSNPDRTLLVSFKVQPFAATPGEDDDNGSAMVPMNDDGR